MILARLVIAAAVLTSFAWLHWHTMPFIGVFRLDQECPPFPKTGAILAFMEDQTCTAAYSLNMLETGWSIVKTVWPFIVFDLLLGSAIGYPLGELARRKLAVEQLSKDAVRKSKEFREDAHEIGLLAQSSLERALLLFEENWEIKKRLEREGQEIFAMKIEAETEMEAVEEFRKKNAMLHAELVKAGAKIQRLEKKLLEKKLDPKAIFEAK